MAHARHGWGATLFGPSILWDAWRHCRLFGRVRRLAADMRLYKYAAARRSGVGGCGRWSGDGLEGWLTAGRQLPNSLCPPLSSVAQTNLGLWADALRRSRPSQKTQNGRARPGYEREQGRGLMAD